MADYVLRSSNWKSYGGLFVLLQFLYLLGGALAFAYLSDWSCCVVVVYTLNRASGKKVLATHLSIRPRHAESPVRDKAPKLARDPTSHMREYKACPTHIMQSRYIPLFHRTGVITMVYAPFDESL